MIDIEWWVYLVVLAGLLAGSLLLHVLVIVAAPDGTRAKKRGLTALFLGVDNRTSTSKLQALLWTYAILWTLICVLTDGPGTFNDVIGDQLRDEYFLLLGGPYLVAIAAKAKTTYDVNQAVDKGKPSPKQPKSEDDAGGPMQRVAEIVINDEDSVDLGDFQYFVFTLLALTYFAWAFIDAPSEGLPDIPGTLLILTGVSQATYLGKKLFVPPAKGNDENPGGSTSNRRSGDAPADSHEGRER
jgi:hypothetical protein